MSKGGHTKRGEARQEVQGAAERRRRKRYMQGKGPTVGVGCMVRSGRTQNMLYMSVTLEVSRLNGWLNADAPCGVAGGIVDRRIQRQGVLKELTGIRV